jgi:hypothetical protein
MPCGQGTSARVMAYHIHLTTPSKMWKQQKRQCTYNVPLTRVRETSDAVAKPQLLQILSVSVASMQRACAVWYAIYGMSASTISFRIIS